MACLKVVTFEGRNQARQQQDRQSAKTQEVKLGFIHDTIKNCYLLAAIRDEMSTKDSNGNSQILSSKSIIADHELINFIADAACHDHALKDYLRRAIDLTKTDKSDNAVQNAANCITILVAASYSFCGQDLSNISIKRIQPAKWMVF